MNFFPYFFNGFELYVDDTHIEFLPIKICFAYISTLKPNADEMTQKNEKLILYMYLRIPLYRFMAKAYGLVS